MKEVTQATIKRLFARSGNRCAFPNCTLPIVEDEGAITGTICHIKARSKGGPRYDPKQTAEERRSFGNLVVMCARHGKLIDADPKTYTVEVLQAMKAEHERKGFFDLSSAEEEMAKALYRDYRALYVRAGGNVMIDSPGGIQANTVNIKTSRTKVNVMPAAGTLGSDAVRCNYVKHLIDRYNEFASKQPRRKPFSHAQIYSAIKGQFKTDWQRILLLRFDDLVSFLQGRINRTQLGRINIGKGAPNYSTFEEYRRTSVGET